MDKKNDGQPPATDDQELAKVLAGMNQQADVATADPATNDGLQYEESAAPVAPAEPVADPAAVAPAEPAAPTEPAAVTGEPVVTPEVTTEAAVAAPAVSANPELDSLKKDALEELRPLVDKLDLPAQEKFDTLLLIIRSTDDQSLLAAAHESAKAITDDAKRAEALLDVIKEIDFFTHQQAQA